MDKRKGIILAIVLFLIIGLGTFVFAGTDEQRLGSSTDTSGDPTEGKDPITNPDTSDDPSGEIDGAGNLTGEGGTDRPGRGDVTTPVIDEVETPETDNGDDNNNDINWASLLNTLTEMVNSAENRDDILEAIKYRNDNSINDDNIASLGQTALDSLATINTILDDEDAPSITPDLDKKYFQSENLNITISDATEYEYVLERVDGEAISEGTTLANIQDEGAYRLTVVDSAFNETVVTFTVDNSAPTYGYLSFRVDGDATSGVDTYYATKGDILYISIATSELLSDDFRFVITDSEGNEFRTEATEDVWTNDRDEYVYQAYIELPDELAEGKLTATVENVTDFAGNTAEKNIQSDKVVVDRTPIEKAWLYVLNNTYSKTNLEDKHYTVIGDGQELYVELVFEEMPATTPLIQIGNAEAISMDACYATDWDTEIQYYKCPATIKIDSETQELENGQLIPVKITNIKDAAGNETILTNDHIDSSDKYDEVVFDKEAPEATKIRMYGGKYSQDTGENIWYVNEDSNFTVYVEFAEELFVNPKLDINDITGLEMKLSKCEDGTCYYYYKFSEIEKLNDGFVSIKVYDYSDAAGNVGDDLFLSPDTNQEIELDGQKLVYIDKTNPTRGYSTLGFEYTDNSDKTSLEINGEKVYYVKPGDSFLYKIAFSEKIQDGLIATIAGTDISLEYLDYNEDLGYIYGGTYTVPSGLTEGERLEIVVSNIKDLAGNEYAAGTITDVPTSNGRVAVFDNTPAGYNSVDFYVNNGYQEGSEYYATYGSTIVANIRTNELLRENPTFEFTYGDEKIVISGDDVEFTDEEKEEYTYLYRVRYTIPEDFEKIEEEVTLNITNIVDYAGKVTDNGSTTVTNSKRVFIDTLAPQVEELRFNSSNSINNGYANNTHSVGVYITVHEELASDPTFMIDEKTYSKSYDEVNTKGYLYAAVTKLPEDTEEGKLTFSVTVTDKMGNTTTYTNDDIENDVEGYDGVIYDTTAPGLTVEYWNTTVEADKDAIFEGPEYSFSDNFTAEEDLTITQWCDVNMAVPSDKYQCYYSATDLAGNSSSNSVFITVVDTTPATITANQKDNYHVEYGSEFTPVTATVTDNVDETSTNYEPRVYIRYTYPSAEYNTGELYYNDTFNTTIPGYYLAIWDYIDLSGNVSTSLKNWVIVSDTTDLVIG